LDNVYEAAKIARLTPDVKLLLRLAVSASSSLINLSAKFGAPVESALEVLEASESLGLDIRGISFHVGSQCINPEDYRCALSEVRRFWDVAASRGFRLEVLDIGGGFPAPYRGEAPSMEAFGAVVSAGLRESFGDLPIRIVAEPGRGLSAECTTLITQVIGKNVRGSLPWYYLDDGIYGSFSGIVFDHASFPLWDRNRGDREVGSCVVAGPTCDSGDVICRDQMLPSLEIGELILVPSMGAYAGASACPFNGLPVAKSVCVG
jgi:ornithine decarboxylase